MMEMTKRILSFMLAMALLIGSIPAVIFAAEASAVSEDAETVWLEGENSCYVNNYAYMELFGTTASEVTWTLSDPSVAEIYYSDATCLYLYGISAGTVTVTATTESGLTASFEVTVMATPTSGTCGDNLTWNLDDEGTLTISGTGEMTSRPWRTSFSRQIKNIVIENGVTSIYRGAFWGCRNITELAIPASVTSIGEEAFLSCYNLQSFSVDPANTAFCASEGVLFNADMTKLVAYPAAKEGNYTIPKTVKTIGYKAFDSAKIEQLTIPASVTTLENYAFDGTIGFYVDADNSVFASGSAGELYSKDKTVLYRYCTKQAGETYTVADGVVTIANGAFEGNISKVVFPDSVQTIGGWAFNGMGTLKSVTFGTGLKEIGDCAFQTCTGLKTIYFTGDAPTFVDIPFNDHVIATAYYPAGNPTWTSDVMQNYGYDSTITWVPYTPGESGGDEPAETEPAEDENIIASGTCGEKLTWKLDDEGTLTISGTGDMKDWTGENQCWGNYSYEGIKTIVVEEGVTSIGNYAFASIMCQSVELPSTLTSIGDCAFWMCYSLNSVNIPENVTTIGENAFCNCIKLESVVIPDSVTSIGKYAFRWCYALQSLELPDSITVIEDEVFYECESLTTIVIPDSVISIGADAFHSCKALANITIPDGVTTLGRGAFDGCTSLTSIKIPASITDIPLNAFNECSGLTSVEIPDGVTSIGMCAFWHCSNLTCITLPDSLTSIDVSSFEGCTSLKKIIFMGDAPKYNLAVFCNLTVTACYPADNDTWTSDVMQTYGGALTWVPYGEPQVLDAPVVTITANESTGKPVVKWNTVDGAAKYRVYRSTKKTSGYELVYTGVKARSYTDKTAKAGTNYYYKVKAIHEDSALNSGWSNVVNRVCDLAQPTVSITGSSTSGKPIVKWETVKGAVKYRVYRSTKKTSGYELVYTGISARSYTDKTAKAGTTYYYKVKAIHSKSSADSAYSDVVSRLCDLAKPEVTIKLKNGDPRLTWDKVSGAAKYYIYRATSKDGKYTKIKTTVSATSFTDTTAKAGTKYYYKVKAVHSNTDANSAYSSIKYITAK